jgi:hypothetical protein
MKLDRSPVTYLISSQAGSMDGLVSDYEPRSDQQWLNVGEPNPDIGGIGVSPFDNRG